ARTAAVSLPSGAIIASPWPACRCRSEVSRWPTGAARASEERIRRTRVASSCDGHPRGLWPAAPGSRVDGSRRPNRNRRRLDSCHWRRTDHDDVGPTLLLVGPEHAKTIGGEGWTKQT